MIVDIGDIIDLWRPSWIFAHLTYFRNSNFLGLLVCYSGHFIEDLCGQINSVAIFSISKVSLPGLFVVASVPPPLVEFAVPEVTSGPRCHES